MESGDGDEEEMKYSIHYDGEEEPAEYYSKAGKARVTYANGDTFEGELADGRKHGKGVYVWKEAKASYEGQWADGQRNGDGRFNYPDGSRYEGGWEGDARNGKGTLLYPNGDSYCGQWVGGQREGHGIYSFHHDRSQLVGQWKADRFVAGKWRHRDGTQFVGTFEHGTPDGRGTFTFCSGNHCHGVFRDGGWEPMAIAFDESRIR